MTTWFVFVGPAFLGKVVAGTASAARTAAETAFAGLYALPVTYGVVPVGA